LFYEADKKNDNLMENTV